MQKLTLLHTRLYQTLFLSFVSIHLYGSAYGQTSLTPTYRPGKEAMKIINSIVVLNNKAHTLPLTQIDQRKMVSIGMGHDYKITFDSLLNKYHPVESVHATPYLDSLSLDALRDDLKFYNTLFVQLSDRYVCDPKVLHFIKEVEEHKRVVIAFFGAGKNLAHLNGIKSPIIWSSQHHPMAAGYAAQLIFGGLATHNVLHHTYSPAYRKGAGACMKKIRLGYVLAESSTPADSSFQAIDSIAREAIAQKASPSAVVMVVKDGWVIYHKAFGTRTYEGPELSQIDDLYDLASITKIAATTLGMMRLTETGKIKLDQGLKHYLGRTRGLDKGMLTLRELLLHEAGVGSSRPFYRQIKPSDYSETPSEFFSIPVANNYFLRKDYYQQVIWPQVLTARVSNRGKYLYSDLSMYFMKEVIENAAGVSLDQYVRNQFYQPLGMTTAGFNPTVRFKSERIVPTEYDTSFRKSLLRGYVHDPGAALLGGVAGHAGLFGSANDLAILFQMFLNGGSYGGKHYFHPKTIALFTSGQSAVSRRGLGFDRKDPLLSKEYPSKLASDAVYGHTGYTGTCVWVDPKYKLIYIFLSNRVYPQASPKLLQLKIRGRIQDAIYETIHKIN